MIAVAEPKTVTVELTQTLNSAHGAMMATAADMVRLADDQRLLDVTREEMKARAVEYVRSAVFFKRWLRFARPSIALDEDDYADTDVLWREIRGLSRTALLDMVAAKALEVE